MLRLRKYLDSKCIFFAAMMLLAGTYGIAQAESDPHRPACRTAHCRQIEAFLKAHYCGESPYGNGPENGCQIKIPKKPRPSIDVMADINCDWVDSEGLSRCRQLGQPSERVRGILIRNMQRLGLPSTLDGQIYFNVWRAQTFGLLAQAYYSRVTGSDLYICQVILVIDKKSRVLVLRKVPFQKTDADVPTLTLWDFVDLVDVDSDGRLDIVLEGDAYENHWLEVIQLQDGSAKMIFSGLGYYL